MFELVLANQRDSIAMQQYFLDQIEHLRVSVPDFFRDSFQNYNAQQAPWRGQLEQTITELTQVLQVTIEDHNRLAQHINTTFANVDSGFNNLAETVYSTIPEAIAQASATQQAEVNRLTSNLADLKAKVESFRAFPPKKETEIWNVIWEAQSGTRANPRQPTLEVIPDPRIPVLTTQVRGVEARLGEIQAELATLSANLGDHKDGCCPGINNSPRIHCAERLHELSLLVQQLQGVDATHGADIAELDAHIVQVDLQLDEAIGMATSADELSNRLNARFDAFNENPPVASSEFIPLRSTVTALSLAVDSTRTTASAVVAESACLRTSMDVAEESLRRLWALSDDVVS